MLLNLDVCAMVQRFFFFYISKNSLAIVNVRGLERIVMEGMVSERRVEDGQGHK